MKIQLFDDDDLKRIEDAVARAVARGLYRAVATLAKNNLWAVPQAQDAAPDEEIVVDGPPPRPEAVAPPPEEIPPDDARMAEWSAPPDPEPPAQMAVPEDIADIIAKWGAPAAPEPAPAVFPPIRRPLGADYAAILSVSGHRPDGYITDEDARELLDDMSDSNRYTALKTWVLKKQVRAVIVTSYQPNKGLPGRVCVLKADVLERNKLRRRTAKIRPGRPGAEPRYDGRVSTVVA